MSINELYFGKDDAERDYTNSGLLKEGFLKTTMYKDAKKGLKSIVVGRKGSGKSAICLMLHNNFSCFEGSFSCIITPDAISADELRRFELLGINEEQAKKLVWRYIFLVQIAKFVIEIAKKENIDNNDIVKIRNFLITNNEINDLTFQEKFWKIIHRIKASITLSAFGQEVEIQANETPNEGIKVENKLVFLENFLIKQLTQINNYSLFLLIDKVDEIWNNDSWSDLMVISLLMAIKEINERIPQVSCLVFLRKDIYDILKFHDRDKFRGDEIHISWRNDTLEELILLRANASLNSNLDKEAFWNNYFVPSVQGVATVNYLMDRTLKRPRDIIQFCNLCRDNAIVNSHEVISEKDILEATDVYSSWKINDLIAEWKVNFPFLNDLFILFSNSSYLIPRERFQKSFNQIRSTLLSRYQEFANNLTEDGVLNILYSVGFVGIERLNRTYYYFDDPKTVEFKDSLFVIHPCFRNALKSTSSLNLMPFEGMGEEERYSFETLRHRGASRFLGETVRSLRNFERLDYSFENFLDIIRNDSLPKEISNEIVVNISAIRKEVNEMGHSNDIISLEVLLRNTQRFIDNLHRRLQESEFLSPNSNIIFAFDKLRKEILSASQDNREYLF